MIHFTGWINVYDCSAYMVFVQFMALFGIMHTQMEPMVKAHSTCQIRNLDMLRHGTHT
jgi:hypothetical protein